MSADNYYVVRKHPDGGYTYVCCFASDDEPDMTVRKFDRQFDTFDEAYDAAMADYSEYGVTVHEECGIDGNPQARGYLAALAHVDKALAETHGFCADTDPMRYGLERARAIVEAIRVAYLDD